MEMKIEGRKPNKEHRVVLYFENCCILTIFLYYFHTAVVTPTKPKLLPSRLGKMRFEKP